MESLYLQKYNIGTRNCNEMHFDRFCFWFTTIDLLFLPYFTFFSVSFSVPIIVLWMALNSKSLLRDKEVGVVVFMACAMFLSTVIGLLYTGDVRFETTFSTSVKRLFQYILCFGYYFFYKLYFKRKHVDISRFILIFIVYVAAFAIVYMLLPQKYATLKIAINPADNHTRRYLAGMVSYRFNYMWTDPNNIAYLVDGLVCWYILRSECSLKSKVIVLLLSLLIIASTVSNGGLIIFVFMLFVLILRQLVQYLKHTKIKVSDLLFIIFLIFALIVVLTFTEAGKNIYETFITQIETRFLYYFETQNISGGRFEDLKVAKNYFNPIFLIIGSGNEGFTSENGHLYWICMYGFWSYIGFIWLMFRKTKTQLWKDYIWIFPLFVAFTVNIAIGEFKWMAIYLMLLAYSRYSIDLKEIIYNYDSRAKIQF